MKRTLTLLLITASFVIGAASLAAQTGPPKRQDRHEGRASGQHKMMEKLNLTDSQKKQLETMRTDMQKEAIQLRSKVQLARIDLRGLIKADDPDRAAIEKKLNDIAALRTQQKMLRIDHWFDVKKILTPEQQKIWKSDVRIMMMNHRGPMGNRRGMMGGFRGGMRNHPGMSENDMPLPEDE